MRLLSIVLLVVVFCMRGSLPAAESTPFSLGSQGGILVAVVLNGAGPFPMLLDTGASHSAISEELAQALQLQAVARTMVQTPVGEHERIVVRVDRMKVGAHEFGVMPSVVPRHDLAMAGDVHGVVGQDVLAALRYTIDFRHRPNNGLWLVDVQSGKSEQLHKGQGVYESVLAPDGSALFVAGGEPLITRLPLKAGTGTLRGPPDVIPVPGVPGVRGMSISRDGRVLGFAGLSLDSQTWKQPVRANGSAAGVAVGLTADTSRRNSVPVVSPEGGRIAYVSTRRGEQPNIWMMDINGGEPMQLTSDEAPDHKPGWFRDGRRVAFVSRRKGVSNVWAVDVTTRRAEPLIDLSPSITQSRVPGWLSELQLAPSMGQLAFSVLTPPLGLRRLYVTGTDSFAPRAISGDMVSAGYPAWSPDERFVAVEVKDGASMQAGVIAVASGALRLLTRERGQTWVRSWSPDGRRLAVAAMRDGIWSLRAIEVATGRQELIHEGDSPRVFVRYPEWSARGDTIVFERGEMRANVWTLALAGAL